MGVLCSVFLTSSSFVLPCVYSTSLESWSIYVWLEEIPFGECSLAGVSWGWKGGLIGVIRVSVVRWSFFSVLFSKGIPVSYSHISQAPLRFFAIHRSLQPDQ